jgi:hypothetical protein
MYASALKLGPALILNQNLCFEITSRRETMDMKAICPCPNLACPNHGYCDKCTSRHTRLGYLNYCAFQTLLPAIQKVIDGNPDSPAAKDLKGLIGAQLGAYEGLMETHGLSKENQDKLLKKVAEFSEY